MRSADELRTLVDDALAELALNPDVGGLEEALRYSLDGGGKRIRPVICLAVGEALGCDADELLPAACGVELVHTFSLVHDDLPPLDDDAERRGRASTWSQFGEAVGVLAGDALLAEAFRLAASYPTPDIARELANATLGMIGGQYADVTRTVIDVAATNRLKTGRLFEAAVVCALRVCNSELQASEGPWLAFAAEVGALFQLVDDLLDGDGFVVAYGEEETRRRADHAAERALAALDELEVDTSVLSSIVESLATRSA